MIDAFGTAGRNGTTELAAEDGLACHRRSRTRRLSAGFSEATPHVKGEWPCVQSWSTHNIDIKGTLEDFHREPGVAARLAEFDESWDYGWIPSCRWPRD